jgi:hypothetical protein
MIFELIPQRTNFPSACSKPGAVLVNFLEINDPPGDRWPKKSTA